MTKNIKINSENKGQRLDKFLTKELTNFSRSQIQKMIKVGEILVNGKKVAVHYFLKAGDKIKLKTQSAKLNPPAGGQNSKLQVTSYKLRVTKKLFNNIKTLENNKNFIIINKPAGLLVHPTEKNETNTLVDWLVKNYPELKKIGEDPSRPAIVHRLDKDVSGLMLIPKTQTAFDYFKQQFKEHKITKKYIALVDGEIKKDDDEINFPISRSKTKPGLFAARPYPSPTLPLLRGGSQLDSKKAITRFNVIKRFKNYTLLEIEILTGRTHQIRVHMLAYGHPVIGDKLYGTKIIKQKNKKTKIDRIFLHANYLSFLDLNGEKREFKSRLPKKLDSFIKK